MKKQYQIEQQRAVQQFRRIATEQNPNIQMILPLAEIVGLLQQGVGNLLRETGLALMQAVMKEEVRHLAGEGIAQSLEGMSDDPHGHLIRPSLSRFSNTAVGSEAAAMATHAVHRVRT